MNLPVGLPAGFAQGFEAVKPILVIVEDGFAAVAAIQDVVDRAGVLHAQFSGPAGSLPTLARFR